ncbi:hypothetical protein BASA60_005587 [Batrachochytrium salamandrivorans]|nr:hypothetical protein BASA60_005587 [Batrachochytrium salamandrivorans]
MLAKPISTAVARRKPQRRGGQKPSKPHAQRKPRIPSASLSTGDASAKSSSVAPASVSQGSAKRKREVDEPNIEAQTLSINDEADLDALEDANVSASDPSPAPAKNSCCSKTRSTAPISIGKIKARPPTSNHTC